MEILVDGKSLFGGSEQTIQKGEYRLSSFCIMSENGDGVLLCQTATGGLVLLSPEEYEQICDGMALSEPWRKKLAELRFLCQCGADEYAEVDELRRRYYESTEEKDCITDYTILPTTRCNARCFYCYEQGIPQKNMSRETAEAVAAYIIRMSKGRPVHLGWFGGEPTLGAEMISLICCKLREKGAAYTSGIISNGLLLDEQMIRRAKEEWNVKNVQITLDGTAQVYQQVKNYKGNPKAPFHTVLSHIAVMLEAELHVSVRINLGLHNLEDVQHLITQLAQKFPGKRHLGIYVHKIDNYYPEEDRLQLLEWTAALNRKLVELGLQKTPSLPAFRGHSCMADRADSVVINPDGKLGKCEHYVVEKLHGAIDSDVCDVELCKAWRKKATFEQCRCCPLYPSCLQLEWCNGGEYICSEKLVEQKLGQIRENMGRTYQQWKKKIQNFRQKRFILTAPYRLRQAENRTEAVFGEGCSGRQIEPIPVNGTSIVILEVLRDGAAFQEIVQELEERYNADMDQIRDSVGAYLRQLLDLGVCRFEIKEREKNE